LHIGENQKTFIDGEPGLKAVKMLEAPNKSLRNNSEKPKL
jgi:hypothetical protein